MAYIPHPQVPLGNFRPNDMFLLLAMGGLYVLLMRFVLIAFKAKPSKLIKREKAYKRLQAKVTQSRNKGPSAFVETSKLERQQLSEEKALADMSEQRQASLAKAEKIVKNMNRVLSLLVFLAWYGIPIMEFEAHRVMTSAQDVILSLEEGQELATSAYKAFLFPLSVIGVGIKFSKWGLANPHSSSGALLVFWSAQATVSKIMDGVDALVV